MSSAKVNHSQRIPDAPSPRFKKSTTKADTSNPDAIARLVGRSNEITIILEGETFTVLLDSGAQVSDMCHQLCLDLGLEI